MQNYVHSSRHQKSVSCSVMSDSATPWTITWQALLFMEFSPGKNTGVESHSLFQEIFPTQELTQVSCTADRFFTIWDPREVQYTSSKRLKRTHKSKSHAQVRVKSWSDFLSLSFSRLLFWFAIPFSNWKEDWPKLGAASNRKIFHSSIFSPGCPEAPHLGTGLWVSQHYLRSWRQGTARTLKF